MERPGFQFSVASMLGLVACIAFNIWLFRLGPLLGIIGLNITKHVMIAWLCQVLGVDRKKPRTTPISATRADGSASPRNPEFLPPPPSAS